MAAALQQVLGGHVSASASLLHLATLPNRSCSRISAANCLGLKSSAGNFRTRTPSPLAAGSPSQIRSLVHVSNRATSAEAVPAVVLTRERGKNEKLRKSLEQKGIACLELPLIEHRHGPDMHTLEHLLKDLSKSRDVDWITITSPEAAAVFLESWRAAGRPAVTLAVVGGGTGEAFAALDPTEKALLTIGFTPSKATAKTLAAELPVKGDSPHVVYPSSLKASTDLETGLRERGFRVTRLNTYSTETASQVDESLLAQAARAPVATFASPTAVKAWTKLVLPLGWHGAAACIGETSAAAARKAGLERVFHPAKPGIEGWVASVEDALAAMASVV